MDIAQQKKQLRTGMHATRAALGAQERREKEHAINGHLYAHLPQEDGRLTIGSYSAINGEVGLEFLHEILVDEGHNIALPAITAPNEPLQFRRWQKGDVLAIHPRLGMAEPLPTAPTCAPSILLVPLLACDRQGNRLGYGGGYYDRTIRKLHASPKGLLTIGVGFACQQVLQLPREPHDETLDALVTEEGVRLFD